MRWWEKSRKRLRDGLYDEMPEHPGPGTMKMEYVWAQAVADGLDGYAKEWLRLGGHVDATTVLTYGGGPRMGEEMDTGQTMLMMACFGIMSITTKVGIVDLLLSHGAAVDKQDINGCTALHQVSIRCEYTTEEDQLAVIRRLLQAGADPSIPDNAGRTALLEAECTSPAAAVRLLCERHVPFDDAAQQHAATIAASAGKPGTRQQGLVAIHAVLNRKSFARDADAWSHYGSTRQRFYEWKALLNGGQRLMRDVFCVPIVHAVPVAI